MKKNIITVTLAVLLSIGIGWGAQQTILSTDTVKDALVTKCQANFTELYNYLAGVSSPTLLTPTITSPALAGASTGTYTLGGTISIDDLIMSGDTIVRSIATDELTISGGSSAALGGHIILYGQTHATTADYIAYVGKHYFYDESANQDRGIHVEDETAFTAYAAANWTCSTGYFYKDPMGRVHLRGYFTASTGATTTAATLPAGYRPAAAEAFPCGYFTGSYANGVLVINTNGTIVMAAGGVSNGYVNYISGISFKAS